MLGQIFKLRRNIAFALLLTMALLFVSCATQDPPRLVADPDDRPDSALPWNKQEKWEVAPNVSNLGPTGSSDTR
jgi:hypothetical protein